MYHTKHNWRYMNTGERQVGRRITMYQVKRRNRPAPYGSGMPGGSKLHWSIKARQWYRRLPNGKYLITMKGTKGQAGYSTNRRRRLIKTRW